MPITTRPLIDRLLNKFLVGDGCWEWIASKNDGGYGQISPDGHSGKPLRAHRVMYELLVSPIPENMTIDHLCRNRACVRPSHMEVVTRGENVRRGIGAEVTKARAATRHFCKRNHEYTDENTYYQKLQNGYTVRSCRKCHAIRQRSRRVQPSQ